MPPRPPAPWSGPEEARLVTAADHLQEGTLVRRPIGAHFHRVLRAVHTVVTLERQLKVHPETTVSGADLRQTEREDAVSQRGALLTAAIAACSME